MVVPEGREEVALVGQIISPTVSPCQQVIYKSPAVLDVVLLQQGSYGSLEEGRSILQSEWYPEVLMQSIWCHKSRLADVRRFCLLLPVPTLQINGPEIL